MSIACERLPDAGCAARMVKVVLVQIEVWHSHLICGLPFHFLGALGRMRSLCRLH